MTIASVDPVKTVAAPVAAQATSLRRKRERQRAIVGFGIDDRRRGYREKGLREWSP